MRRREYVKATGAAVIGSAVAGCTASDPGAATSGGVETKEPSDGDESDGSKTGRLATSVTDQPVDIDDFESCVITIEGVWVKPDDTEETEDESNDDGDAESVSNATSEADERGGVENDDDSSMSEDDGSAEEAQEESGETDGSEGDGEGRRYIEFDEPQKADLVRLQGANTQLIDETELAVGEYRYLQLDVGGVEGTLVAGGEAEVDTPGNAPLQFKKAFEIRAGERTRFVADFAPVRRGQGARYLLRPVASGTRVLYGDEEYDPGEGGDSGESDEGENGERDDETAQSVGADERTERSDDAGEN